MDYLRLAVIILEGIESLFGVFINVFIVTVLLLDWVKSRSLNACNLTLVSLGISNVVFILTLYLDTLLYSYAAKFYYSGNIFRIANICCYLTLNSSSWLIACLCVFYCFKIVNLNQPLFNRIKMKLPRLVPWMITTSLLISVLLSVPVYWECYFDLPQNETLDLEEVVDVEWTIRYTVVICVFGAGVPGLLVVLSMTVTVASLWKHTKQMKQNTMDTSQPQLQALTGAAKTMSRLLILYIFFQVANISIMSMSWNDENENWDLLITFVLMSYTPTQSFTLVLGTSRLKQTFMRMLRCSGSG
ncbi:taste receptor type 2 member 40-like [Pleurodeles waltl]|uniref:taste receptor type 2 member 40-like n=1 Tax=Pleurodeles waltl TaxID=8319 RepID=UPI0037096DFF